MKIIDGIKYKGNPFEIPDCCRDDLPEFFKEMDFKIGAEIGVQFGENLELYCKTGFTMYGIDPWINYDDAFGKRRSMIPRFYETMDEVYDYAVKKLSSYPNCTLIRKKSMDALADIPNRSLDFIYIDASHKYGHVAMDLMEWSEKVKKGGIITGHDYHRIRGVGRTIRQVKYAVGGFVKSCDIDNWYLLGRKKPLPGEINDKVLSYMMFKHW